MGTSARATPPAPPVTIAVLVAALAMKASSKANTKVNRDPLARDSLALNEKGDPNSR
jgi:hypothetical protein